MTEYLSTGGLGRTPGYIPSYTQSNIPSYNAGYNQNVTSEYQLPGRVENTTPILENEDYVPSEFDESDIENDEPGILAQPEFEYQMLPIRCYTCGKVFKERTIEKLEREGKTPLEIFETLGYSRFCCRMRIVNKIIQPALPSIMPPGHEYAGQPDIKHIVNELYKLNVAPPKSLPNTGALQAMQSPLNTGGILPSSGIQSAGVKRVGRRPTRVINRAAGVSPAGIIRPGGAVSRITIQKPTAVIPPQITSTPNAGPAVVEAELPNIIPNMNVVIPSEVPVATEEGPIARITRIARPKTFGINPISSVQLPSPSVTTYTPAPVPVLPAPASVLPAPASVLPAPASVLPAPAPAPVLPAPVLPAPVLPAPAPASVLPAPAPASVLPAPAPTPVLPAPVLPAPAPVLPAPAPVLPAPAPVLPAPAPVLPAPAPVLPAPAPVLPAPAPVVSYINTIQPQMPVLPAPAIVPAPVITQVPVTQFNPTVSLLPPLPSSTPITMAPIYPVTPSTVTGYTSTVTGYPSIPVTTRRYRR